MDVVQTDLSIKAMRKKILILSWPAIIRLFLQSLVGTVDVIMVGKLTGPAIGAVGVSNRIVFIIIGAFTALSVGSTALVAHYIGAKDIKKGNEILWQSILISLIMGIGITVVGFLFSESLLKGMLSLMDDKEGYDFIIREGVVYIKIVLTSMIFGFPMMIINAVFQGVGDMKTPLYLMIITNIVNVIFNYLLIFGHWIFPEMGVAGAALGTAISRMVGCLIGVGILIIGKSNLKLTFKYLSFKLDTVIIKAIFKIGIPSSVEQFARQGSQIIITIFVAGLGAHALDANEIVMNINNLAIMPGFGFGVAALTLVGQSLGAGDSDLANRYAKQTALIGILLMLPITISMFIFAEPLVMLFDTSKTVVPLAVTVVRIIIITQPILTLILILAGALRGAGDTMWVMISTIIGNWGARVVLGILFGYYLGIGLTGFYLAIGIDIIVRALLMLYRFKSGKWKNIKVLSKKDKLKEVIN